MPFSAAHANKINVAPYRLRESVNLILNEDESIFLDAMNQSIPALIRSMIKAHMARSLGYFRNAHTYAAAMELSRNPRWQELAKDSDDWQELREKLRDAGIGKTWVGLSVFDRRINTKIMTMFMRDGDDYAKYSAQKEKGKKRPKARVL